MWSIFSIFSGHRAARPESRFRPAVEPLEDRVVPAPFKPITIVKDLNSVSAQQIVNTMIGTGITATSNITYKGAPVALGTFSTSAKSASDALTGGARSVGIGSGAILGTGQVKDVVGPNKLALTSTDNLTAGDTDVDAVDLNGSFDAAAIEFDFVPKGPYLTFNYVFGSDEYNEFVGTNDDDLLFLVNGQNAALIPGTATRPSSGSINNGSNSQLFVDNTNGAYNTEMDGFTRVMTATAAVNVGQVNHIKIVVADSADGNGDTWLMIKAGSFSAPGVVYAPMRYSYTPNTGIFSGALTVGNASANAIPGQLYLVFSSLPPGVTLLNPTGFNSTGKPYIRVSNGVGGFNSAIVNLRFRNSFNADLRTFFLHHQIDLLNAPG